MKWKYVETQRDKIERILLAAVCKRFLKITGKSEDGELLFMITKKGLKASTKEWEKLDERNN